MEILFHLDNSERPSSVALGFFDGIHLGHRAVINNAVSYARTHGLVPAVFTLLQSPRQVLFNEKVAYIISLGEKLQILESMGVEKVYVIDFTEIRNITAERFVSDILKDCFHAAYAVCGFNYHFGKAALGNRNVLKELCESVGICSSFQSQICYGTMPVSSTRIRQCIASGDIPSANAMLGRTYGFCLTVVHGRQLGRTWGTPTLNQWLPQELICPKFGVYVSEVTVDEKKFCGVTNIGVKPTVGSKRVVIETWLPDYQGRDLYDECIDVRLLEFIREERKFSNVDLLRQEIFLNAQQAKQIFARRNRL